MSTVTLYTVIYSHSAYREIPRFRVRFQPPPLVQGEEKDCVEGSLNKNEEKDENFGKTFYYESPKLKSNCCEKNKQTSDIQKNGLKKRKR
jgi:hypothetical protein